MNILLVEKKIDTFLILIGLYKKYIFMNFNINCVSTMIKIFFNIFSICGKVFWFWEKNGKIFYKLCFFPIKIFLENF